VKFHAHIVVSWFAHDPLKARSSFLAILLEGEHLGFEVHHMPPMA
jgi:hypothetical protein